ncbi:hypothetical protein HDU76_001654 [Blyttiomyces sp. JEL0837]|nr:hypothetical protein HDU76_001654 [Blyttiomyces sp. JEL0837]
MPLKKAKTDEEAAKEGLISEELMTQIDKVQEEFEEIGKAEADEIAKINAAYERKRLPLYKKRDDLLGKIPNFWLKAMQNHDLLLELIEEDEAPILESLKRVAVDTSEEGCIKMTFTFAKNDYFSETEFVKVVKELSDDEVHVDAVKISWTAKANRNKKGSKAAGEKRKFDDDNSGFFDWLESGDSSPSVVHVANVIAEDFYPRALTLYMGLEDDLEGFEDDEGEDEEEDEE